MTAIHAQSSNLFQQNVAQVALTCAASYAIEYAPLMTTLANVVGSSVLEIMKTCALHQMAKTVFPNNRALHVATRPGVQLAFGTLAMVGAIGSSFIDAPKTGAALSALAAAPKAIGALTLASAARQLATNNEPFVSKKGLMLLACLADRAFSTYATYRAQAIFRDFVKQVRDNTNSEKQVRDNINIEFMNNFLKFELAKKSPSQAGCPNKIEKARLCPIALWDDYRCK